MPSYMAAISQDTAQPSFSAKRNPCGSLTQQLVLAAALERAQVGRPGMDLVEVSHKPRPFPVEAAAHPRGLQRKAHLDVRGAEARAGEPLARREHRLAVALVGLDLVLQAELLEQPQHPLRARVVQVVNDDHGLVAGILGVSASRPVAGVSKTPL